MVAPRPREPLKLYIAATPQTASAVLVIEREEPVLAKKSTPSPSPEPPDKEAASSSLEPQVEPVQTEQVLPEGLPQENLDKASSEPREKPNASTSSTTLVEHPVYFVSTVLRDARGFIPLAA